MHHPLEPNPAQVIIKQPHIIMNVARLLLLPHRQFILFYEENHRRIMAMATQEEWGRVRG